MSTLFDRYIGELNVFRRRPLIERLARRASAAGVFAGTLRPPLRRLYHVALHVRTLGRGLKSVLPEGEVVRVLPEYAHVSWNPDEYRAFRRVVRSGAVALDIGANVGSYALLLGQWVGTSGSVFAFEPAPGPFAGLVRHIALNGLTATVHPIHAAVGRAGSEARMVLASSSGESRLAAPHEDEPTIPVALTSVDAFCGARKISPAFMKIDAEGAELAVLQGARETIRRGRGRMAIFVEMHPSIWPRLRITKEDIIAELTTQGLEALSLVPGVGVWSAEGVCAVLRSRR
jgi:FkbM family methyltransferase